MIGHLREILKRKIVMNKYKEKLRSFPDNDIPEPLKIWRSPYSDFGKVLKVPDDLQDETITAVDVYDNKALREIADNGFNAIWLHGLLQNIVCTGVFPELGKRSARHLRNMRKLIARAKRFGIKVFIYMQPPQGLNVNNPFWKKHPEVGGHEVDWLTGDDFAIRMRSFCTSTQKVKRYLKEASANLAAELPDLGGVILITASEFPSHCWGRCGDMPDATGHRQYSVPDCPRCSGRAPSEIVNEIINLIRNGIHSKSRTQQIIAWNWAWDSYEKAPCSGIIENLPKDIILMAGFEQGGFRDILGKRRAIDEYALSYAGPSAKFKRTLKEANKKGLKIIAKLQIGTTHELATVPNIPLIGSLYEKAKAMRENRVDGFQGCWNFGNMLTANTAAFNSFLLADKLPSKRKALTSFAKDYLSGCNADIVVDSWNLFSEAMNFYPFSMPFLYSSPINYTLVYPLKPAPLSGHPAGRSWQVDKRRGDCLELSLGPYSLAEVIRGLGELARKWKKGTKLLEKGVSGSKSDTARKELDNAWACYHVFRSVWNTYRVYKLRLNWSDSKLPAFQRIAQNELENLEQVLPIIKRDKRFGYHSEPQAYMFDVSSIRRKIRSLEQMIS